MQPLRVKEDSLLGFKLLRRVKKMTVTLQKAPANSVPAAAVIRRVQTLLGVTGRKGRVGGPTSQMLKALA